MKSTSPTTAVLPTNSLHSMGMLVEPLTDLLHEAYAPLAAKGMRYLATHQPSSKTLERLREGESYLIFTGDELVGTVTLYRENPVSSCEYYRKPGVFSFGQFAVRADRQKQGIGSFVMTMLETRAKNLGATELALDTSEKADHLIQTYRKRGYDQVSFAQWDEVNYRSVIMSKHLCDSPKMGHLICTVPVADPTP